MSVTVPTAKDRAYAPALKNSLKRISYGEFLALSQAAART